MMGGLEQRRPKDFLSAFNLLDFGFRARLALPARYFHAGTGLAPSQCSPASGTSARLILRGPTVSSRIASCHPRGVSLTHRRCRWRAWAAEMQHLPGRWADAVSRLRLFQAPCNHRKRGQG